MVQLDGLGRVGQLLVAAQEIVTQPACRVWQNLVWNKARQVGGHLLREVDGPLLGGLEGLVRGDLGSDANQSPVCPVGANGVGYHVGLGCVLVGNASPVSLIPVDDKLPKAGVANDVFSDV